MQSGRGYIKTYNLRKGSGIEKSVKNDHLGSKRKIQINANSARKGVKIYHRRPNRKSKAKSNSARNGGKIYHRRSNRKRDGIKMPSRAQPVNHPNVTLPRTAVQAVTLSVDSDKQKLQIFPFHPMIRVYDISKCAQCEAAPRFSITCDGIQMTSRAQPVNRPRTAVLAVTWNEDGSDDIADKQKRPSFISLPVIRLERLIIRRVDVKNGKIALD